MTQPCMTTGYNSLNHQTQVQKELNEMLPKQSPILLNENRLLKEIYDRYI